MVASFLFVDLLIQRMREPMATRLQSPSNTQLTACLSVVTLLPTLRSLAITVVRMRG